MKVSVGLEMKLSLETICQVVNMSIKMKDLGQKLKSGPPLSF